MRTINKERKFFFDSRGFSIAELLIGILICTFIVAGTWGVYEMGLIWWNEQMPMVEIQRVARLALSLIVIGQIDPTAGTDTAGGVNYTRRNGISGARDYTIVGGSGGSWIRFGLEVDPVGTTPRSFLLVVDNARNQNVVQYIDDTGATYNLNSTLGIGTLRFDQISTTELRVTVTATRTQTLNRPAVTISYNDTVFLKNY